MNRHPANTPMAPACLPTQLPLSRRKLLQRAGTASAAWLGLGGVAGTAWATEDHTGGDPLGSMQWPVLRKKFTQGQPVVFSEAVLVQGPPYAEDAMNVPISVDARPLLRQGLKIERMLVVADRNPVQQILSFQPAQTLPVLAFRFRLEQGSPVRALVLASDGRWHVGQTWVNAAGGGCTVPGATRADGSWSQTLNQVQARFFRNVLEGSGSRLRLRVMHPMDTGLVAGIPAFYIEEMELRDSTDRLLWRLELHEPVSENPLITFEMGDLPRGLLRLQGRDNNGNRIAHEVQA